jgi:hypothetical protein
MNWMVISEFPKHKELNPILYDRVYTNLLDGIQVQTEDGVGGRRTDFNLQEQKIQEIDELISWIEKILPDISTRFASKLEETVYGYNLDSFEVAECWGVHYNKGESLVEHCHFPYALSFVYYVRTPKGTAPIIIEDRIYDIEEGQCLFFLASKYHSVSKSDCDGRCAIVGNIMYRH